MTDKRLEIATNLEARAAALEAGAALMRREAERDALAESHGFTSAEYQSAASELLELRAQFRSKHGKAWDAFLSVVSAW